VYGPCDSLTLALRAAILRGVGGGVSMNRINSIGEMLPEEQEKTIYKDTLLRREGLGRVGAALDRHFSIYNDLLYKMPPTHITEGPQGDDL